MLGKLKTHVQKNEKWRQTLVLYHKWKVTQHKELSVRIEKAVNQSVGGKVMALEYAVVSWIRYQIYRQQNQNKTNGAAAS